MSASRPFSIYSSLAPVFDGWSRRHAADSAPCRDGSDATTRWTRPHKQPPPNNRPSTICIEAGNVEDALPTGRSRKKKRRERRAKLRYYAVNVKTHTGRLVSVRDAVLQARSSRGRGGVSGWSKARGNRAAEHCDRLESWGADPRLRKAAFAEADPMLTATVHAGVILTGIVCYCTITLLQMQRSENASPRGCF